MISAYSELYLDVTRKRLAIILDYATSVLDLDIEIFWPLFLSSSICNFMEKGDPSTVAGKSGTELTWEILEESHVIFNKVNYGYREEKSPSYWLGWALSYFQWSRVITYSDINRFITIKELLSLYHPYHEMDITSFCDYLDSIMIKKKETKLAYYRKNMCLTQRELALLSDVPKRTIEQYEQRQKDINKASCSVLFKLATVLKVNMEELIEKPISLF